MNPNQNFTPLQLLQKKETGDSESYIDTSLRQPPNLSSYRSKSGKIDNIKQSSSKHPHNEESPTKIDVEFHETKSETLNENRNSSQTKMKNSEKITNSENLEKLRENGGNSLGQPPRITMESHFKVSVGDSRKSPINGVNVNGMKGSILKQPNSPKKIPGNYPSSPLKKVSVKEVPDILYVEKYASKNKKCACGCRIF